jgi:hypothetical protein
MYALLLNEFTASINQHRKFILIFSFILFGLFVGWLVGAEVHHCDNKFTMRSSAKNSTFEKQLSLIKIAVGLVLVPVWFVGKKIYLKFNLIKQSMQIFVSSVT